MKKFLLFATLLLVAASASHAAIQEREVTYSANGTALKGYIAYDDAIKGKRPASWWCTSGGDTTITRAGAPTCWR